MTNYHEAQEERAAEYFGLRPSTAAICPRVVAGKRCLMDTRQECVCRDHHLILDHGRMWLDGAGNHVLTGEPYDTWGDHIAEFTVAMTGLGLRVHLTGRSFWNPGSTLLIRVTKEED